jgi:hypothetical protein
MVKADATCGGSYDCVISDAPLVYGLENVMDSCEGFRVESRERDDAELALSVRLFRGDRLAMPSARMSLCMDLQRQYSRKIMQM